MSRKGHMFSFNYVPRKQNGLKFFLQGQHVCGSALSEKLSVMVTEPLFVWLVCPSWSLKVS